MKSIFAILVAFMLCGLTIKAQVNLQRNGNYYDSDGNPNYSKNLANKSSVLKINIPTSSSAVDNIRALDEINIDNLGCGYPYISLDGLRLYFTKSVDVQGISNANLYFVSRSNLNSPFSNRQLVSSNFAMGSTGCWLTNDELEIFFRRKDTIYYSSRTSIENQFATPQPVNLNNYEGYIQGISLTPDKKELYFHTRVDNTHSYIFKYMRIGNLSYTLQDTLSVPSGFIPTPGQLSKDGLKYLVGLTNEHDTTKLYQYSRTKVTDRFSNATIMDNGINNSSRSNTQTTITADEKIIVWVKNNDHLWTGNAFYIQERNSTTNITEIMDDSFSIYPNSENTSLIINGITENIKISIYDISGRFILCKQVSSSPIDISNLHCGVYFVRINDNNQIVTRKFVKQ
jgi:Secretion system C-terminal sorting domain